jgi:hypothetical protein
MGGSSGAKNNRPPAEDSFVSYKWLDEKSPRTKRDYFEIGQARHLPLRCPILQRCERRSFTIALRRRDDGADMLDPPKPSDPVVSMIEAAGRVGGSHHFHLAHCCPEVALFEESDSFPALSGHPMTSADYDKSWVPPYRLLETGHYSECAEYVNYSQVVLSRQMMTEEEGGGAKPVGPGDVMMILKRVASRFPAVVAQFSTRRKGREPLTIADEYDVQYVFQSLLEVEFTDIRPEEAMPSTAGGSMRADCLLKAQRTIIEFKMTRTGYDARALRRELAEDFVGYGAHPDCGSLFVFVYDPGKHIANPSGVENDLSKPRPPIENVHTFIQQG